MWNVYRDEINGSAIENNNDSNKINKSKSTTSKSLEYKTKTIGRTQTDNNTLGTRICCSTKIFQYFLEIFGFVFD